ncbi:MAG: AIR synthase-related protein, partial [Methanoregulaceae archaeon]|nr:AIR synthase-related protein [Methanoregulaceae archaeon]
MSLALIGNAGNHFGGSVLDTLTGCGGSPPPGADPALVDRIRTLFRACPELAVTDISQGGLAAALASFCPGARVELDGSPLAALFSETYGRFLVAFREKRELEGIPFRELGEVTAGGFDIRSEGTRFTITRDEVEFALSSLTRTMRG